MGSRPTTVAVAVLAMSLAAPAISAATQPEIGLGQARPALPPAPSSFRVASSLPPQTAPARAGARAHRLLASASGASSVTIRDFSFDPNGVTVHAGDTVTWTNDGKVASGHTVTGKGFDSGVLPSGKTYSHTFSSPGTFSYVCQIHPFMKGTVTVLASSPSAGSSPPQSGGSDKTGSSGSTSAPAATGGSGSSPAPSSSGTAGSSGSLPFTGSDLWLLALTGLELAAAGVLLRRLAGH